MAMRWLLRLRSMFGSYYMIPWISKDSVCIEMKNSKFERKWSVKE